MPRRLLLSLLLALAICLGGLPGMNATPPALAGPPPLAETLATTFPTLSGHLATQADAAPASRAIAGQTVAGLSVTPIAPAPPAGLKPEEQRGWQAAARHAAPAQTESLSPFFPNRFTDPFQVEAGGIAVSFRPLGANAASAAVEDGKIVYRDAYQATDSLHAVTAARSEEFLLLRSAEAPTRFEYEILATSGTANVSLVDGAVRFAASGKSLMIEKPWLVDATGKRSDSAVRWELGAPDAASVRSLALMLDPTGLTYPLAIDPTWLVGIAPYPGIIKTARIDHTATLMPNGKLLVAGGQDLLGNAALTSEIYDPITGGWADTSAMAITRYNHTATLLPKGKVLVAGGFNGSEFQLPTAEVYDPEAGAWTTTGSMATARERHTATLLPNGLVLVAGGQTRSGGSLQSAELYNPATGVWSPAGAMTTPREKHTATLLPNGLVLVTGGFNGVNGAGAVLNTAELYNPATNAWAPTGAMAGARFRHTATLMPNGDVLVLGGCTGPTATVPPCTTPLDTAERYSPSGSWAPSDFNLPNVAYSASGRLCTTISGATINGKRYDHTATLLPSGQVLVVGGRGIDCQVTLPNQNGKSLNSAALYTPGAGWIEGSLPTFTAPVQNGRYGHTATMLPNGQTFIVGGNNIGGYGTPTEGGSGFVFASLSYDPAEGSFAGANSMPIEARADHTATLLPDGKVLVVGGSSNNSGQALSSAALYDPTNGAWTPTGGLNTARFGHTATLLLSGQILVVGGLGASVTIASAEIYNPTTGVWTTTGNLTTPRYSHAATLLRTGQVLVSGGNISQSGYTNTAEKYDVTSGVWSSAGTLATSRARHTSTQLPDGKVLVVGGFNGVGTGVASAERFDPLTVAWSSAGAPGARSLHSATLLPTGQVLVAGGQAGGVLNTSQLYTPETNAWAGTLNTMTAQRYGHTATLLGTGWVLVTGGYNTNARNDAELYITESKRWRTISVLNVSGVCTALCMQSARYNHTATLLPNGKVLLVGGYAALNSGRQNSAEIYDRGHGYQEAWRPNLTSITSPLLLGSALVAGGDGFKGLSEASGGNGAANSSTNYPLLQLQSMMNEQQRIIKLDQAVGWSSTSFTSIGVTGFSPGYALATIIVNGIPSHSRIVTVVDPTTGATSWYFAEGYTGTGFDEYLTIQNPNAAAANVKITYFLNGAASQSKNITVPGNSRYTVTVHDAAEGVGRGKEVSAKVETTNGVGIIAERPMYFTYSGATATGVTGGHNVMGATAPQQTWYFAEGYTGAGFDEYLTIMNPNSTDADVTIDYYLNGGATVTKAVNVPANSRYTVTVHDTAQGVGRDKEVSAKVETSNVGGIVVERPMYFRYGGFAGGATGGHNVMGSPAPRPTWYFPEGNTNVGWDEYLTIMNTNDTEASVTITYYVVGAATPTVKPITIAARSRYTVVVHDAAEGVGRGKSVSTKLETSNPGGIVVERPMYFKTSTLDGGHDIMGAPTPKATWYFAEGYTGTGFEEYLYILNPNSTAASVTITYFLPTGAPQQKTLNVGAFTRAFATVHGTTNGVGVGKQVSARVETTHAGGIIVERPMYFNYNGSTPNVTGGHTVMGYAP